MTKTGALQQWKFKSSMGRRTQFFTFSALNALASPLKQPLTWTTKCCKQLIGKGLVYLHMTSTANDSTFRIMGSTCKVHNIPLPPGWPVVIVVYPKFKSLFQAWPVVFLPNAHLRWRSNVVRSRLVDWRNAVQELMPWYSKKARVLLLHSKSILPNDQRLFIHRKM